MRKWFQKIDQICEKHVSLLILLLIVVLLRIPSFFEPYWYGDEAIYLTIGTGLKQGLRLYTDIIDHKTPLIYYFAMVPNQFWFRVLMLGWMMAATGFFFSFARRLFQKGHAAFVSSLLFVLMTTLPWLEGHIPNGELFVIGFVMAGFWLLSKTQLFEKFLEGHFADSLKMGKREPLLLLGSGALFGLGVLTKVPGILDFGGALLVGWFALASNGFKKIWPWIQKTALLGVGLIIPLVLSMVYYVALGSGKDYLDYGLLYNLRYSAHWQLGITNPLLAFFFTLPGKVVALAGVVTLMSFVKKFSPRFRFVAGWFAAALLASLLSNRPYPHYFLQIVPPFALLVGCLWQAIKHWKNYKTELLVGAGLLVIPFAVALILNLRPYEARSYYRYFYQLATGQISQDEYNNAFNPLVANNYAAADAIAGINGERIFIWGTNPMLYAQTHTTPTSRFTVSFHIKDFGDHERTFEQIQEEKPKIIVVMKDENDPFPQLAAYLDTYYMANTQYSTMTIYLRRN